MGDIAGMIFNALTLLSSVSAILSHISCELLMTIVVDIFNMFTTIFVYNMTMFTAILHYRVRVFKKSYKIEKLKNFYN